MQTVSSADMEPGDADELRYKVAKEMGYTKESTLTEGVLDADDDDGFMARSQLYFLARDAITLHGIIDDRQDLEPWVQSKIAQAAQGIDAVRRYTEYNAMKQEMPMDGAMDMEESKSEDEDLDESLGKLGKYALAAMLGLGAVKGGLDATSARHSPLGQALDHASQNWSGPEAAEASELYNKIDLYADEDPGKLQSWIKQNQDLVNQFKESTVEEGSYGKKKKKKYYEEAEEKHYMCVHADKGTHKCTAKSSYEAAKKAAEMWGMKSTAGIDAHLMEGKYKSDAQRKAVHAAKAEKANETVQEGMEFDEKRNGDLQTVAKDLFANAKAQAAKKVK